MKYLCLAYEEEAKLNALSSAEWLELRQETLDYVDALRESGQLLGAEPLKSATKASVVRVRNGEISVTDGPFAETKEQIGGFFLIEARDRREAIDIASRWPSAKIGSIEVRPLDEGLSRERRYE